MTIPKNITVIPIFSFEEIEEYLDPSIPVEYKKSIQEALSMYENTLPARSIFVDGLNHTLRGRSEQFVVPFKLVFKSYGEQKKALLAQVPYLLGLVKHQSFLKNFDHIRSIEVLENKPGGLFKGRGGKELYLCLKKNDDKYVISISNYIEKGMINARTGISFACIGILSFYDSEYVSAEEALEEMAI